MNQRFFLRWFFLRWIFLIAAFWYTAAYAATPPDFDVIRTGHPSSWAVLRDHDNRFLQAIRLLPDQNRLAWVPLAQLSLAMQKAVLISEDHRFYAHHGVDWQAVLGATWENLRYSTHRGASTLSMQLVGLLDPDLRRHQGGRTLDQKWRQIHAASALEKHWNKAQILEAYLNLAPLRAGLTGIHAAAQGLFATSPDQLDTAQSAILAALLRGPNAKPDTVIWRACHLAQRMGEPSATCHRIRILVTQHLSTPPTLFPAGIANDAAHALLHQPGETLTSSLDIRLQQTAHRMVYQMTHRNTTSLPNQSGAVIILDNASGKILAYASQYPSTMPSPFEQPITVTALAQPLLYAFALNTGTSTADAVENDAPLAFISAPLAPAPDNPIDFDTALANAQYPAAWRIWQQIDQTGWKNFLQSLNLQTSNTSTPAVTGNLINLANAWQMLANHGTRQTASFYPDDTHQSQPILPPDITNRVTSALAQPRMVAGVWINSRAPMAWLAEQDICQTEIAGYTNQITLLFFRQSTTCIYARSHITDMRAWFHYFDGGN
ncbi:transglycosylase domain-containing protein [Halothiobacillus sp.]|uniref:transglycosylase domain-containing protein n=1 Tax=Halothiobacillus sp. TaxID=1891311 RepID=UPI002633D0BA|nr:transglycosylase domain-containing protein [Halothiobacillus sp.]